MRIWRWIKRLLISALILGAGCAALYWILLPDLIERTEIYKGVFLKVEDIKNSDGESSRVMMVEIHWDTHGVSIANRDFSYPVDSDDPEQPHYKLSYADFALIKEQASVLVNTTIYDPNQKWRFMPGLPVRTNETIVQNGISSHIHEHSYLLYWDRDMNAHMVHHKPPDKENLEAAWVGIGLQGIPINNGKPAYNAIGNTDEKFNRMFIGVNSDEKVLYLFYFDNAFAYTALDYVAASGAQYGGQLDSGRSCNLLIGNKAKGILPHTGIRKSRALGGYLIVKAEEI